MKQFFRALPVAALVLLGGCVAGTEQVGGYGPVGPYPAYRSYGPEAYYGAGFYGGGFGREPNGRYHGGWHDHDGGFGHRRGFNWHGAGEHGGGFGGHGGGHSGGHGGGGHGR